MNAKIYVIQRVNTFNEHNSFNNIISFLIDSNLYNLEKFTAIVFKSNTIFCNISTENFFKFVRLSGKI